MDFKRSRNNSSTNNTYYDPQTASVQCSKSLVDSTLRIAQEGGPPLPRSEYYHHSTLNEEEEEKDRGTGEESAPSIRYVLIHDEKV
jgi:hypothetical protein